MNACRAISVIQKKINAKGMMMMVMKHVAEYVLTFLDPMNADVQNTLHV